jgi:hypothetical protein
MTFDTKYEILGGTYCFFGVESSHSLACDVIQVQYERKKQTYNVAVTPDPETFQYLCREKVREAIDDILSTSGFTVHWLLVDTLITADSKNFPFHSDLFLCASLTLSIR